MSRTMVLFPGQGTQYVGMGKALYENYPMIKRTFDEAEDILNFSVKKLCFEGTSEHLNQTINAQVAIVVLSVAAYRQFANMHEIKPDLMAGHSLGEYSALACAGAASFEDILKTVFYRAQIMDEISKSTNGAMLAVSFQAEHIDLIERECIESRSKGGQIWIGAYNASDQLVLTGDKRDVLLMGEKLVGIGCKTALLHVSGAFHSPIMAEAEEKLKSRLTSIKWGLPFHKILANVTGKEYTDSKLIPEYLASQITKPVLWSKSIQHALQSDVTQIISVPPKNIFHRMIPQSEKHVQFFTISRVEDFNNYQRVNLKELIARLLSVIVSTRNYNTDINEYNLKVIPAYRELEEMYHNEAGTDNSNSDYVFYVLELFLNILKFKSIPLDNRRVILQSINQAFNLNYEWDN
ncbi:MULTISPECIES: ACP S-malonyltransferase [Paenibacillus]|uniref:ACP S-malonyltransferase n=1 Tax=Paenibacillus TaxID=44249 RepID=UPI0012B871CC|nr:MULTISPECIES: ACP S-malonyltransferase [Paenibacillus]